MLRDAPCIGAGSRVQGRTGVAHKSRTCRAWRRIVDVDNCYCI